MDKEKPEKEEKRVRKGREMQMWWTKRQKKDGRQRSVLMVRRKEAFLDLIVVGAALDSVGAVLEEERRV